MRPLRNILWFSLLAVSLCGPGLAENQHATASHSADNSHANTENTPPNIAPANTANGESKPSSVAANDNEKTEDSPHAWMLKPDWMIVWVTGAYTIVSTIALFLLGFQIRYSSIANQRQLRAYVVPELSSIANVANVIPDPPELEQYARVVNPKIGPVATIGIKNVGQSPSYNVVHTASIYLRAYTNPPVTLVKLPNEGDPSTIILGPGVGTSMDVWLNDPLSDLETANLKAGLAVIYVVGVITYTDIFGKNHSTHYQLQHHSSTGKIGWNTKMTFSPTGNRGD